MGVFDNMKARLGFGGQPEWQDNSYQEGFEPLPDDRHDDGYAEGTQSQSDILSFDSYNPENFGHVTLKTDRDLKVATYDTDTSDSYFARRSGYGSNIGTSSRRDSSNVRSFGSSSGGSSNAGNRTASSGTATWDTPAEPSFLGRSSSSNLSTSVSDILAHGRRKPEDRLVIIKAKAYADVESVATAARTGKIVVLVLTGTRAELSKRILDFSFGVASALNGTVDKLGDKIFVISRDSNGLSDEESAYLRDQGII